MGFEGGKMLLRIDLERPGARRRPLEACARAVVASSPRARLVAMVEPFWPDESTAGRDALTTEAAIKASAIAAALGHDLGLHVAEGPGRRGHGARSPAATTLPTLLLGGEVARRPGRVLRDLALGARGARTCVGLVVGRSLLYPADDDVAAAVDTASGCSRSAVGRERRDLRRADRERPCARVTPASADWASAGCAC